MANFVNTTLMDGYAGGPHITEKQSGLANQAIIGEADYVLEGGQNAKAQVLTNNSIRIFDAVYSIQGRRDVIAANDYADVTIANGSQGMNRNDIIVRRYRKNSSSEIESTEYAVIKGTPSTGAATDPSVTVGDIRTGAVLHEMKLYRVRLEGLNIVSVDQLFTVLPSMATMQEDMTPSTETLKSGVRLQRMGKLRILNLVDTSSAADGTIVNLAAGDRPANYVFAPAVVRGQTYPDFFISVTPASMGTGKVGLFRGANVQMQYDGYICSQIAWLVD
ncbi:hypothetical protein DXD17_02710 [[Ruminococcus] lactaris]|uniref:Uncharacterized protein n=1 Tax=[Ruminococcus] lactaris TaxID=46228 RepID=A0A3E4LX00_9FIRM|nr:hypothetical protein [[Ruminococcus] lactaris]RGK41959.1 hypothetical protein DXD17_02710 [[Ruminococcus] lactaris]